MARTLSSISRLSCSRRLGESATTKTSRVPVQIRGKFWRAANEPGVVRGITTAFTCRAGCKERDVSENRNAVPVKCNALFGEEDRR